MLVKLGTSSKHWLTSTFVIEACISEYSTHFDPALDVQVDAALSIQTTMTILHQP